MSVIIRLQGLPWSANAMNIRHFFTGLSIPAGGVHIIGGDGGDAFIAFSSDDDARVAMKKNMCPLNGTPVQLFLSSKSEMQSVIDAARAGSSLPAAGIAGAMSAPPHNMQQQQQPMHPQSQLRHNFQNMPNAFSAENQGLNNAGNVLVGQQSSDFNSQMHNQFSKNDWHGFPMPGGHMDDQTQQMSANFPPSQRMALNPNDGRFPGAQGSSEARGQFGAFHPGKAFPDNSSQFQEPSNTIQHSSSLGVAAAQQLSNTGTEIPMQASLSQKSNFINEQNVGRQGNLSTPVGLTQNESLSVLQGNINPMGRGQGNFSSSLNMGPNRDMFSNNVPLRPGNNMRLGNLPSNVNEPGNRGLPNEGLMGRPSPIAEKVQGDSIDPMVPTDTFGNSYIGEKGIPGPDGRQKDMMQWSGDSQPDARLAGSQKPFDQDARSEKLNLHGRNKMPGPDGRAFEQFPFRNEFDRRERADIPMDQGSGRPMDRQDRDPLFPGRDIRMGGRFPIDQEQGGRFPDRPKDRFGDDQVAATDESTPSTRYPPDDEPLGLPSESRPPGRFPQMRGRPDDARFPSDDRRFPSAEPRIPPEDRRMPFRDQEFPPEEEEFSEGDRKFPPATRGFPPDDRFPPNERQFPGGERGPIADDRRLPLGSEGRRFPIEEGMFPQEERMGLNQDRIKPDEYTGRRPGDNPFAPDDIRFRDREDEMRRREPYGRGRRAHDDRFMPEHQREGRPDRPGFRDFEENEEGRLYPWERRIPLERNFRGEEERDARGPLGHNDERRGGMSRWDRERFDDWQEGDENFPRHVGPRGPIPNNPDLPGIRRPEQMNLEGPMDMDQRAEPDIEGIRGPALERGRGPTFEGREGPFDIEGMRGPGFEGRRPGIHGPRGPGMEGMRGRGMEGFRGRGGMDGMRGRGIEGMRGRVMEGRPEIEGRGLGDMDSRSGPGIEGRGPHGLEGRGLGMESRKVPPGLLEENSFDYGHGSGHGRPPMGGAKLDEEFDGGPRDFDNRFSGPAGRGGMFDRPQRGRGDFFYRGRGGPPFVRGRGMEMERRFEEAPPEDRYQMDVDARNVGSRPDAPPLRPLMDQSKLPDFNIKPGSGKGLLGDAPASDKEAAPSGLRPESDKKEGFMGDTSNKRDIDSRSRRSHEKDRGRDHRSSDRRGRDRDDRRSGDRDRSRYRYERDRSDRRRSRSRDRSSRDKDGSRSKDRSGSSKIAEGAKSDSSRGTEQRTRNIYIKNMPLLISYKDVRRFLQPLEVPFDGLKMINDEKGQRTGEAYVQFRRLEDAVKAIKKSGEKVGGQAVHVSFTSDGEFAKAIDSFNPKKDMPSHNVPGSEKAKSNDDSRLRYIVMLKNLPLSITKQDIVQFFKGLAIDNNGEAAFIEFDHGGVATGRGFVEFKSDFDYKKALTQDGNLMGTLAIRVFPGKKEEADDLKLKQTEMFQRAALRTVAGNRAAQSNPQAKPVRPAMGPRLASGSSQQPSSASQPSPAGSSGQTSTSTGQDSPQQNSDTVCVHIQGLPLLATPQDIREFFSDCQIAMRGINIAHDSRGKPLGEGFVEFKNKVDFDKAIKKDKTSLGRHIVAVKPIGKKEMLDRLDNARQSGFPQQQEGQQGHIQPAEESIKSQNPDPSSSSSQEKHPNQPTSQALQQGPQNNPGSKPAQKTLLPGPLPPSTGANMGMNVAPGGSKLIPPGVLNKNWFYVRCQNFPPDITISEIMGFFQGFRPLGESIRLHYSSEGKPTGNAVVGFGTPEEAQTALHRLNLKMCRQNIVSLHSA